MGPLAAVGVMCKAPRLGQSKTRLAAAIGAEAAAILSACFLRDTAVAIESIPTEIRRKGYGIYAPAGAEAVLVHQPPESVHTWEGNTTLAVVLTDAKLSKTALLKVCQMAFGGFYRTLAPALSLFDGDLVVALSSARRPAHVNQIGVLAERVVAEAILVAVREAEGFGLLPSASGR